MKYNGVEIEFDDPEERKRWGVLMGGKFYYSPPDIVIESTAHGFGQFEEWAARQPKSDWK